MGGWGWLKEAVAWVANPVYVGQTLYFWKKMHPRAPKFTPAGASQLPQSAAYGRAVPVLYGTVRVTANLVYSQPGAFYGGDGTRFDVGVLVLAEGELGASAVKRVWRDRQVFATLADFTAGTGPALFLTPGEASPAAAIPTPALYGTTNAEYYARSACLWGALAPFAQSIGSCSFEVAGLLAGTGGTDDAHPADMIRDFLTNGIYGAGYDTNRIVTDVGSDGLAASSARRYVTAEGLWLSAALTEPRPAREWLAETLKTINCDVIWSEGKLKILPYGDQAVTGNSVTYTPDLTIQYALSAAAGDFLPRDDGDPIEVEVEPLAETRNIIPVEFIERAPAGGADDIGFAYNVSVVESPIAEDVAVHGVRKASPEQMHMITSREVAQKVSRVLGARSIHTRTIYRFTLGWRFCRLEPMDFVSLTDPLLGISGQVVRIRSIEEDPKTGNIEIEAEEWAIGIAAAPTHVTASSDSSSSEATYASVEDRLVRLALGNWGAYSTPAGQILRAFAVRGDRIVLVTSSGIYTSDDLATTWTQRLADTSCTAVADDGTTFVVLGGATGVLVSASGTSWATATAATATVLDHLVRTDGRFVAIGTVGGAHYCMTSDTGASGTWTARTVPATPSGSAGYDALAAAGKYLVATFTRTVPPGVNYILYEYLEVSQDGGLTWAQHLRFSYTSIGVSFPLLSAAVDPSGRILCASGRFESGQTWTLAESLDGAVTFTEITGSGMPQVSAGMFGAGFYGPPLLARTTREWIAIYDTGTQFVSRDRWNWTRLGQSRDAFRRVSRFAWVGARGVGIGDATDDKGLLLTVAV